MGSLPDDASAHLDELRREKDRHLQAHKTGDKATSRSAAVKVVRLFVELDEHLVAGGAPPVQWLKPLPPEAFPPSVGGYYVPPDGGTQ